MTQTYHTIIRALFFSVITCSLLTASIYREFDLDIEGNSLSLNAKNVPLRNILHELQKQTNIQIRFLFPISENVTTRLKKIPLDHAIQDLLSNFVYKIHYSNDEIDSRATVSEVLVITTKFSLPTKNLFATDSQSSEVAMATLNRL